MSLKALLGLETCQLSEREIMRTLADARRKKRAEETFPSPSGKVVVQLSPVNTEGVMRSSWNSWV